jgi:hypothetical protein
MLEGWGTREKKTDDGGQRTDKKEDRRQETGDRIGDFEFWNEQSRRLKSYHENTPLRHGYGGASESKKTRKRMREDRPLPISAQGPS